MENCMLDEPEVLSIEEKHEETIKEYIEDFQSEITRMLKGMNEEDLGLLCTTAHLISDECLNLIEDLERLENGE